MELIANYLQSKLIVAKNYYVQFISIEQHDNYDINKSYEYLPKSSEYNISFLIDRYHFDELYFDIKANRPIEIEDMIKGKIFIDKISSCRKDNLISTSGPANNIIVELIVDELTIKNY